MENIKIASELVKIAKMLSAIEFPNQQAFDRYLKDHPKADKANHSIVKSQIKKVKTQEVSKPNDVKTNKPSDDKRYNLLADLKTGKWTVTGKTLVRNLHGQKTTIDVDFDAGSKMHSSGGIDWKVVLESVADTLAGGGDFNKNFNKNFKAWGFDEEAPVTVAGEVENKGNGIHKLVINTPLGKKSVVFSVKNTGMSDAEKKHAENESNKLHDEWREKPFSDKRPIYHGTSKAHWEKMKKSGFIEPHIADNWAVGSAVFFTTDPQEAKTYANKGGVILKIPLGVAKKFKHERLGVSKNDLQLLDDEERKDAVHDYHFIVKEKFPVSHVEEVDVSNL